MDFCLKLGHQCRVMAPMSCKSKGFWRSYPRLLGKILSYGRDYCLLVVAWNYQYLSCLNPALWSLGETFAIGKRELTKSSRSTFAIVLDTKLNNSSGSTPESSVTSPRRL